MPPVIAEVARELGIPTVALVTRPFAFEGAFRARNADGGIEELKQVVDTIIIVINQNLFRLADKKATFADAFRWVDEALISAVRGITDLIFSPGLSNFEFSDLQKALAEMGQTVVGLGEASGMGRAITATEEAIGRTSLTEGTIRHARRILINVSGGPDMTPAEVEAAVDRVRKEADSSTDVIFGTTIEDDMRTKMRVSITAGGVVQA